MREYGRANEPYRENGYVVSQVREHLQRATEGILSDTERAVMTWYVQELVSSGEFNWILGDLPLTTLNSRMSLQLTVFQ